MKKKTIWIVALLLLLTLSAVVAFLATRPKKEVAGEKPKTEVEQRSNVKETDAETGEEYYLLADFENYFECAQIGYNASFGKVTQITKEAEPEMVPYGNQSAKLEILGTEETWYMLRPTMRIGTNTAFFDETTDFSNVSRISFDIYNAQDYEASIRFYVDDVLSYRQNRDLSQNTDHGRNTVIVLDLEPNSWNHIEIPAEDMKVYKYDKTGKGYMATGAEALSILGGINIEFDRGEIHEEQEVFYFDNLRAYLKSE